MQETELRPPRSKTPLPSSFSMEATEIRAPISQSKIPLSTPSKLSPRPESPRPGSRADRHAEGAMSSLGKETPKPRPKSLYVDSDLEFLRSYDGKHPLPLESAHTGLSTASHPGSLPSTPSELPHVESEQDLDFLRHKDEEGKPLYQRHTSEHQTRLSSSSAACAPKHTRQTSLGALSKGIVSSKFVDAFRKFEGFSHHETKVSDSRLRAEKTLAKAAPEEVASADEEIGDWKVESHDVPVKVTRHLKETRKISKERESRSTVGEGEVVAPTPHRPAATSTARLIQQRMNEYLNAQHNEKPPPLTAEGYGPYISDARAVRNRTEDGDVKSGSIGPSVLPKPSALRGPSLKGSVE